MGLLDNNKVLTSPLTGVEGSHFKPICSNDALDAWVWEKAANAGGVMHLTYGDIFVWSDSDYYNNNLYIVKGKITDEPTIVAINDENFPNLRKTSNKYPSVMHVIACPATFVFNGYTYGHITNKTASHIRLCVIFSNGQIYHNYPSCYNDHDFYNSVYAKYGDGENILLADLFTKFDESVVWDLPNRKHPVKTTTGEDAALIATGMYYYNPALKEKCYELHPAINQANGYGNTVGFAATNNKNNISDGGNIGLRARFWRTDMDSSSANSFSYMGGYIADNLFTMIGTYRNNAGTEPSRTCVFGTQDGGRNWYCMYEFAGKDRCHVNDNYVAADGAIGIPLAQTGSVSDGVYCIKRRIINVPDSTVKEPSVLFEYDEPVNVSNIVGDSSGIIFTVASHGLAAGDCIVVDFQNDVSANNRAFDWMVNSSASSTDGGNGILFKVTDVTSDTFKVTLYIWNPDSNLPIRHIHALNRCKDGVSVSCGERYPHGGWILYDAIEAADAFAYYNIASLTLNKFVRLNSTNISLQRPLGVIVQKEADGKTYCYVGMDDETILSNNVTMPEGRTESFKHNSTGVWKVAVDGIDSLRDNAVLKYQAIQTCFGFQQIANAFVFTGQYGKLAISYDCGETWTECNIPYENWGQNLCHFSGPTYDRKFSIDNVLVQLKK